MEEKMNQRVVMKILNMTDLPPEPLLLNQGKITKDIL